MCKSAIFRERLVERVPRLLEVAIVGKSAPLAELAAILKNNGQIRLISLEPPMAAAAAEMDLIAPDVIIFDRAIVAARDLGPLILRFPGVKLIGLEEEEAPLVVATGSERTARSVEELAREIAGKGDFA